MTARRSTPRLPSRGFTLIELLVTITILSVIAVVLTTMLMGASRSRTATANAIESANSARTALDMISSDLRCAGYGIDLNSSPAQTPIAYIDSLQVLINANLQPFPDTLTARKGLPLAYKPTGSPKPFPLNGTSWQPTGGSGGKYLTGAETIRWTLDVNNDGQVNSTDLADPNASDAQRTRNPNDYELVRQVYGDSTGGTAGNNGGAVERVALIKKPGGGVQSLFTVYLDDGTKWNWSSGPVPANKLKNIKRVVIEVTATSARPDWRGRYSDTPMRSEVNSMRNTPNFNWLQFTVSGYVYEDKNKNGVKDGTDVGVDNATVYVNGVQSQNTDTNGMFSFKLPPGTYTMTHDAANGYGPYGAGSYVVTIGPDATCSFADTIKAGGWITATVWFDSDHDAKKDGSEVWMPNVTVMLSGDTTTAVTTEDDGTCQIFAPPGTFSIAASPPDSFYATTTNPATGTMVNHGTASVMFGMDLADFGTFHGVVYNDVNQNGTLDNGEKGVANVYVSASINGGTPISFDYTDGAGAFDLPVPVNDPPHNKPYVIDCIPLAGYALTTLAYDSEYIKKGQTLTGKNFALGAFRRLKIDDGNKVLSLAAGDLVENDWKNTAGGQARQDVDLVAGCEGSSQNVLTWFNRYDQKPEFSNGPDFKRSAPYWVQALALDSLDTAAPKRQLDLIAGTRYNGSGNIFVWYTQNSTGNSGTFPGTCSRSYTTADNGDVQALLMDDCTGGTGHDIIVGTRGPVSGTGSLEVWENNDAASPVFTRKQTLTTAGALGNIGEVTCMAIADLYSGSTHKEMIVGTRTGAYTGQLLFFKLSGGNWSYMSGYAVTGAVTSLTSFDIDDNNKQDVIVGTQTGLTTGNLEWWKNNSTSSAIVFAKQQTRAASGVVTALANADMGGGGVSDLIVGWREDVNNYNGGVQVWYCSNSLPTSGSDPSGGQVHNWVTSIVVSNFDYGVAPSTPPTIYPDIAVAVRRNVNEGELHVFIR